MNRFCLPIIAHTSSEVESLIAKHDKEYGFFEVWLDYLESGHQELVQSLSTKLRSRLIVLFRRQNLEEIVLPLEMRIEIMRSLQCTESYLDLDLSQQEELRVIGEEGLDVSLIASHHDYENCPTPERARALIDELRSLKPEIVKLAVHCASRDDALNLLSLYQEYSVDIELVELD